jgi:hypothetical protein
MMSQLNGVVNPNQTTTFNPGYTGVGDEWKTYQSSMNSSISDYDKASKLLREEGYSGADEYDKKYYGFLSDYIGGLKGLESTVNSGWDKFGTSKTINASDYASNYQSYADQQSAVQSGRNNVYSNILNTSNLAAEALSKGTQLQTERKQRNLTDRSTYYANQASVNANKAAGKAEKTQASAIQNQRTVLGRSGSRSSGYLSSLLNR